MQALTAGRDCFEKGLWSFHCDILADSLLSQHSPTQDLQSCGAPVARGSRCLADARPGTKAPSLRAWLAVLEGDPGCQPFLSPYLEQLSGSCWAPASSPSPAGLSDLMPMQCCHWGKRCPKTEGRCPDQKESLSHGNPDSSQPLCIPYPNVLQPGSFALG